MQIIFIIIILILAKKLDNTRDLVKSLNCKNQKLENEILHLKKLLNESSKSELPQEKNNNIFYTEISDSSQETTRTQTTQTQTTRTQTIQVQNPKKETRKNTLSNREIKNSSILALGAFLIVFAAISFLSSTWNISSSFFKIFVLITIAILFFGLSWFAKNKLKITQTANTFLYIGLAYIPLVLFAFSILNLIGDYFSISGAGKYIYLAMSSLIVNILYTYCSLKNNDPRIYTASRAMRGLFIIFLAAIFKEEFYFILTIASIYSVILNLYKTNSITHFKEQGAKLTKIFVYTLCIIGTLYSIEKFETALPLIYLSTILINALICYARDEEKKLNGYIIPIMLLALPIFTVNIKILELSLLTKQIIFATYLILAFVTLNLKTENIKHTYNILQALLIPIWAFNTTSSSFSIPEIPALSCTCISFIGLILSLFLHIRKEKNSNILLATSFIINYIFIVYSLSRFENIYLEIFYLIATTLAGLFLYRKNERSLAIPLLGFLISLLACPEILIYKLNLQQILIVIATIPLAAISITKKNSIFYTMFSAAYLICFCYIYSNLPTYTNLIFIFGWSILHYIFTKFKIIAMLGFALAIYGHDYTIPVKLLANTEFTLNICFLLNILTIILVTVSSYRKKESPAYYFGSLFFLSGMLMKFDYIPNKYLILFIYTLWGIFQLFRNAGPLKDFTKFILSACTSTFLFLINKDIFNSNVTFIKILELLGPGYFVIKSILSKYMASTKTLEYILCAMLYFSAFSLYTSSLDTLSFICSLALVIMVAYSLKLGPLFLSSILAVILNIFYITAEFWLSIPWWIYLIAIGATLLTFAMKNELKQNKPPKHLKDIYVTLKNKFDL